ncbi:hypothetical protein TorRG33x02_197380 [Trema orientale]|uniref:Uncharacterized protein n=1 Tax=Trema orientale TaxID=63057 RepID=A0A2P5EFT4_TREOI|nr:hypothetical protein TorRG33x02_197380 [Trema orientale]
MGILVPTTSSYVHLLEILYEALGLKPESHTLQIRYIFELGISPVNIVRDRSLEVYFELKKNEDKTNFSLCFDIIREPMTTLDSEEANPDPVEVRGHDFMTSAFVGDCGSGGLEDIS